MTKGTLYGSQVSDHAIVHLGLNVSSSAHNCGCVVWSMAVMLWQRFASGCGEQEVGVASGSGWNLWVWLLGVVVRRYIDFLILLIPTPLVSVLFYSSIPTFCSFKKMFLLSLVLYMAVMLWQRFEYYYYYH